MSTNPKKSEAAGTNPPSESFLRSLLARTTLWNAAGVFMGMIILAGILLTLALGLIRLIF